MAQQSHAMAETHDAHTRLAQQELPLEARPRERGDVPDDDEQSSISASPVSNTEQGPAVARTGSQGIMNLLCMLFRGSQGG